MSYKTQIRFCVIVVLIVALLYKFAREDIVAGAIIAGILGGITVCVLMFYQEYEETKADKKKETEQKN